MNAVQKRDTLTKLLYEEGLVTEAELKQFIVEKAREAWKNKQPYLLARLSPELLKEKEVRYRDLIGPLTLKQFCANISDIDVVQHPNFKAQVGVIPKGENFEFGSVPDLQQTEGAAPKRTTGGQKYVVLRFLELLNELDDEQLRMVEIPVSVLARLIGKK